MSEKFQDRYRVKSARLPGYDYSQPGAYFVTICTEDHCPWFGDIVEGRMTLSEIGEIVREEIIQTPIIRPNVVLDEWVIMPNHVHVILQILNVSSVETPRRGVSTWKPGTLGSIINQLKSVCTRRIREMHPDSGFAWQSRFHDHIVRNEESLRLIREYIRKNPTQWQFDEENPENRQ
ncbi:MAG: transposase [Candidatus Moranbacteria bacterium]|nr:transposase [Candidatus Moranbacteria bacterium]